MTRDTENSGRKERFLMLDALRGFAVLLMIIFHLFFDLNAFRFVRINLIENPFWYLLPRFIVAVFLVCVGMGLSIAHKRGILWPRFRRRLYRIGAWALFITLFTYISFPKNFVFFGILHCIFVSSLAGLLFVNRPKLSLLICFLFLASDLIFRPTLIPVSAWLGVTPFDFIPFYPWFAFVLLGIFLESIGLHKISLKEAFPVKAFRAMGKNSLKIYILHRPIVFGLVFILYKIKAL